MNTRALLALLAVGCSKRADPPPVPVPSTPVQVAQETPAPTSITQRGSFAYYKAGTLEQCLDAEREVAPDAGPMQGPKEATPIPNACDVTFNGRAELATCTVAKPLDGGRSLGVVVHWYDVAALERDDRASRECLELGGAWREEPRTGAKWRRARLDQARKDLRRVAEGAGTE
jgi:hypothetical protein